MSSNPFKCYICGGDCFDDEGWPTELTFAYQVIDGDLHLCKDKIHIGVPLHYIHGRCHPQERV